jgi:hypothetical protein
MTVMFRTATLDTPAVCVHATTVVETALRRLRDADSLMK